MVRRSSLKETVPLSIRLLADVRTALEGFADDDGRSLGNYIARVLTEHVKQKNPREPEPSGVGQSL